jgi:hypothetical protein
MAKPVLSLAPYASAQKIFREYNFRTGAIAAQIGRLPLEIPGLCPVESWPAKAGFTTDGAVKDGQIWWVMSIFPEYLVDI